MAEAWVQLFCVDCEHEWEESPSTLPETDTSYPCPSCGSRRPLAELLLTSQDLATVRELQGEEF